MQNPQETRMGVQNIERKPAGTYCDTESRKPSARRQQGGGGPRTGRKRWEVQVREAKRGGEAEEREGGVGLRCRQGPDQQEGTGEANESIQLHTPGCFAKQGRGGEGPRVLLRRPWCFPKLIGEFYKISERQPQSFGEGCELWSQIPWVPVLALLLISSLALGKLLRLPVPQSPNLGNG